MNQKRIPALLGLFLLIAGISTSVYLVETGPQIFSQAQPPVVPQSVRLTNVRDDQFTVSWVTEQKTTGFVKYGTSSSLKLLALDDRDQKNGQPGSYFLHHVTVSGLKPQQDYYFKIGSGKNLFDHDGRLFAVKTAPVLGNPPVADPAYGKIIKKDNQPAAGAIVYLEIPNTQPLSCLSDYSGNWMISKNLARTNNLTSWSQISPDDHEIIFVQGGPQGFTTLTLSPDSDSPTPEITLGFLNNSQRVNLPPSGKKTALLPEVALSSQVKILASQGYVLPAFTASPSADLSPTPTTTSTLTPSPTVKPTSTPSPTATPTLASPTASPTPRPSDSVPQSGHWLFSILILIFGLLFILGGVVLGKT